VLISLKLGLLSLFRTSSNYTDPDLDDEDRASSKKCEELEDGASVADLSVMENEDQLPANYSNSMTLVTAAEDTGTNRSVVSSERETTTKRKRTDRGKKRSEGLNDPVSTELLDYLRSKRNQPKPAADEDELFMMSQVATLKRLPLEKKRLPKFKFKTFCIKLSSVVSMHWDQSTVNSAAFHKQIVSERPHSRISISQTYRFKTVKRILA
jgi:hypothetical protein